MIFIEACVELAIRGLEEYVHGSEERWIQVIANHLGDLVGQNRCRFLEITEHNYYVNVYMDKIFILFTY